MQNANSFRVNKKYGTIHGPHKNVGWRFPERPPIHIARDHSEGKVTPPVKPSSRGGDQSTIQQNTANHHICHKDHRQLTRQMHSTEEESCPQTRNTQTQQESWEKQHPMPFFADANDNSTKQREAPVGHQMWATDTTTHPFTLPPPNGAALLHLHEHVCPSVMRASDASTQGAFR
ncbi:hypothetical protein TcCL_NonESM10223 [Trypanosoma cruzi]|nr:hypothetical protein TcCL_NonESM10223 [Trypanosoma cruzi]